MLAPGDFHTSPRDSHYPGSQAGWGGRPCTPSGRLARRYEGSELRWVEKGRYARAGEARRGRQVRPRLSAPATIPTTRRAMAEPRATQPVGAHLGKLGPTLYTFQGESLQVKQMPWHGGHTACLAKSQCASRRTWLRLAAWAWLAERPETNLLLPRGPSPKRLPAECSAGCLRRRRCCEPRQTLASLRNSRKTQTYRSPAAEVARSSHKVQKNRT